jgi:hypothetical protein
MGSETSWGKLLGCSSLLHHNCATQKTSSIGVSFIQIKCTINERSLEFKLKLEKQNREKTLT